MKRTIAMAGVLVCLAASPVPAETRTPQVSGMNLATAEGPFRYNDAGVPEDGYIIRQAENGSPNRTSMNASTQVKFRVCNSTKVLEVTLAQLSPGGPCPVPSTGPWLAWKLVNGQLVTKAPGGGTKRLSVEVFPTGLQSIIQSGTTGQVHALSFPNASGAQTFAVIVKPQN